MANDLAGRVDKLSEAVGILSERMARVEDEQRAMRGSIDQLTGEVRQLDKRITDMGSYLDKRITDMGGYLDKRITDMGGYLDKRLGDFDKRLGDFDKRLDQMVSNFDKRVTDIKWVISLGMGLIILLMTLYRFLKLTPVP